jgi:RimJ/RimL family protein N-acetyltransferase
VTTILSLGRVLRPTYPIETARLLLRPFTPDDFDDLLDIQSRPDVARYLYWRPREPEEVEQSLAAKMAMTALEDDGDGISLAATLRSTGELVGDASLRWVSREHRQGEIGFIVHPDHQGRRFATEMAVAMLGLGFDGLDLHRIVGRCDARNAASARVMERLGMRREAHLVENELIKGEWTDELVYAMLQTEWRGWPRLTRAPIDLAGNVNKGRP